MATQATGATDRETIIPILPCRDIDEIAAFYGMLGFDTTYRQTRPNPHVAVRRDGIELHFAGIAGFDPEQSYGSCIVAVADTAALFEEFAAGMRAVHGKLLLSGIPRITRPRKRKNTGDATGFTVVDTGGNWIRVFRAGGPRSPGDSGGAVSEPLARALENAVVLGESRGDTHQAAKILDGGLARNDGLAQVTTLVEALVYRAELALRLDDPDTARNLLDRVRGMPLDDSRREGLSTTLAGAADLEHAARDRRTAPSAEPTDSPIDWVARHIKEYVETDGRKGHRRWGVTTLLLTTRGRRSGRPRRTALIYGRDGERLVVVASNGGADAHPAWYLNLLADPAAEVQAGAERFAVTAVEATGEERERLWRMMAGLWGDYERYRTKTRRTIPVVVLERAHPGAG